MESSIETLRRCKFKVSLEEVKDLLFTLFTHQSAGLKNAWAMAEIDGFEISFEDHGVRSDCDTSHMVMDNLPRTIENLLVAQDEVVHLRKRIEDLWQKRINDARKYILDNWSDIGECQSCGWHDGYENHNITDWEIKAALESDGILELSCLSKDHDNEECAAHRGSRIRIGKGDGDE